MTSRGTPGSETLFSDYDNKKFIECIDCGVHANSCWLRPFINVFIFLGGMHFALLLNATYCTWSFLLPQTLQGKKPFKDISIVGNLIIRYKIDASIVTNNYVKTNYHIVPKP